MSRPFEFYPTPEWATKTLLNSMPDLSLSKSFLEPCNGKGAISRILESHIPDSKIYTNDIDRDQDADHHYDCSYRSVWTNFRPVDWVITNPPFSSAYPIVEHSLNHCKVGTALLLRLSFLEPTTDRQHFLHENPPTSLIVLPRISFTGDGKTDSVTCAWMIWLKSAPTSGIQIIRKS